MTEPNAFWKVCRGVVRLGTTLAFELKVYGARNVPRRGGGLLMVSNHQSILDPVLLGVQLQRPMSYLAKSELFVNPVVSRVLRGLNGFPVRQGAGDVGAVKETIRRLQEGHLLNIFPEGSRTETGEMLPLEAGVGLVVRRAGVPVLPAVIDGSFHAWPRGTKVPKPVPIAVMYGEPMDLSGLKAAEVVKRIETTLHSMLADLRRRDERLARRHGGVPTPSGAGRPIAVSG